jgi:hypothetical protein
MPGLLWFSKVLEMPASLLWCMARTPLALMQQCHYDVDDIRASSKVKTPWSAMIHRIGGEDPLVRSPTCIANVRVTNG